MPNEEKWRRNVNINYSMMIYQLPLSNIAYRRCIHRLPQGRGSTEIDIFEAQPGVSDDPLMNLGKVRSLIIVFSLRQL